MPFEPEQRSHAEEPPAWEDLDAQNERLRQQNEDFFEGVDREIRDKIEFYRRQCSLLSQEIEGSGMGNQLERDNPNNLAINYTETSISPESSVRSQEFDRHCDILFAQPSEAIEGMPDLRRQVVAAHDQLAPSEQQGFISARRVLSVSLGLVLVAGLSALLADIYSVRRASGEEPLKGGGDTMPELNRRAELTSLLLQAAANRPVDTARYGITPERFSSLREAVLALVQELPEELYWEQLALAAEAGYGADGGAYTLGDHFYALDLAFILLEPMLEPQPCDLDLESWMNALGQEWQAGENERADGGVPRLYRSIATQVPDESGATRLTRLFLARAVLAQAALKEAASSPEELYGRSKLSLSISANSFFQISGAAMFCLPPPFMAYGYLANTVLEVLFGGSDSSSSFFDGLTEAIKSMERSIEQIKITDLLDDLNRIKNPIKAYNQSLENKWNELPDDQKTDPNKLPSIDFFDDPNLTEFQQSLRGRLEQFFNTPAGGLEEAASTAANMWENRQAYDPKGEWSLLMWLLLAYTTYLSCSRQLASTYAMIANLRGNTNHQKIADLSWRGSYRPDPSVLFTGDGDGSQLAYWTSKHWAQVRSHIKLVRSPYTWPESLKSAHSLTDARLNIENNRGYYDQLWCIFIEIWRRAELTLSMPAEIYRWCYREVDGISAGNYYKSKAFAHGWVTSRRSNNDNPIDANDDLLPPLGDRQTPGTQAWLLAWYREMGDLHKIAWLNAKADQITPQDQCRFLDIFIGIFTIGRLHQPSWTYFLLQTIRKQIQAWRVQASVTVEPLQGFPDPSRLHGAAWPTTGELSRLVRCLDQALPCSWQAGPDYLNQVLLALKDRWQDMATSGADPSHLHWANDENNKPLKYWWRDRSNADQRPMPLLPETIVLILEVWLAGAIKADRLQQPLRNIDFNSIACNRNEGDFILNHLRNHNCELAADDGENQGKLAYQLPPSIGIRNPELSTADVPNDKDYYDSHRDLIRNSWIRKRDQALDTLLSESYGLQPSSAEASKSEKMAQNWMNGLLDESLNDDLKLQKPTITITDIQSKPGLGKPTIDTTRWKEGNKIYYSYILRGLSSFQASGNDQLSEVSDLSEPLILNETSAMVGCAIRIPRDDLLLARQFLVFRTIVDTTNPTSDLAKEPKIWIGSGHFEPGQLEATIFHDGNPPVPKPLDKANVSIEPASKPPKGLGSWSVGNKVQYSLQYLDAVGTGKPSDLSPLSEPIEISTATCGLKLTIPSDASGIATSVQVQRQIIDPNGKVLDKLKPIALHGFPPSSDPGVRVVEVLDADVSAPPSPIIFRLHMTSKGLELTRSDRQTPLWTSDGGKQLSKDATSCRMQGDGNLVIYNKDLVPYWSSDTMEAPGKTDSQQVLRLRANGELAIVNSIRSGQVLKSPLVTGDPQLPLDRPDVFLRRGEMMLPDQSLSTDNQSPQAPT
jgi:hypothetical protein